MRKKTYQPPTSLSISPIFSKMLCGSKVEIGTTDENVDNSDKSASRLWSSDIWNDMEEEQ